MTRLFAILPTIGFLLALYGVPGVILAVAAIGVVTGFGLGYAAAVREHARPRSPRPLEDQIALELEEASS